ncbi:MAG: lamin tail domain-containing protein [Candidatus Eisenbacteria bacterium]|uniref:Lamin tail domain-containing protein n=1 Tax=Eiseniibacteriota bacterium TaxID=2212470 RepID=A0A956RQ15_UNCEI|nr:lamin tail domain-containing protein [Candidatus Eisenbacteria bacterium]
MDGRSVMRCWGWIALGLICAAAAPGRGSCQALLNEIMADPATDWDGDGSYDFRGDEWIEIVNVGIDPLDLTQLYLGDESGGFVYGFEGTLASGEVRVVYGSQAVPWEQANGEAATGLRLGNDGDTATLWQVANGDTLLVDAYSYNTQEAEDDRSTGRNPDGSSVWEIFDALNPYAGQGPPSGNGLAPTPGARNDGEGSTPVASSTWGRVKRLFTADGVAG